MTRPPSHLLRLLAFPAAAGLCALLANAVASPERRLAWTGRPPVPAPQVAPAPPVPAEAVPAPPAKAAAPTPRPAAPRFPADPAAPVREISSRDARDAYGLHVPFLDARRTEDFLEGHVAGAWSAPVWESACAGRITDFEARANPGPRDPIVIYCAGGGCEDSRLLAGKLMALGYRNLLLYAGGYPDWTAQARPVEKGARP
jgi:rhodanese-related sulfurtransferase